jgi:hypothetical protein
MSPPGWWRPQQCCCATPDRSGCDGRRTCTSKVCDYASGYGESSRSGKCLRSSFRQRLYQLHTRRWSASPQRALLSCNQWWLLAPLLPAVERSTPSAELIRRDRRECWRLKFKLEHPQSRPCPIARVSPRARAQQPGESVRPRLSCSPILSSSADALERTVERPILFVYHLSTWGDAVAGI